LIVVVFDGVDVGRIILSEGTEEIGDFALDGVFVVVMDGEYSILSNCSLKEATPLPVGLGDEGVGDRSRIILDGDCERGCNMGVCWDVFRIVPFDGVVVVVVDEVRFGITFVDVDGEDGNGSDLATWEGDTFPPDT
jgi:hypothetical protein